ncbi:hypothetical protein D3C84_766850 [compost metagenome]
MDFGGAAALTAIHHLTLATEDSGHVGQRSQIAAGADRAFLGDQRQHVMLEEGLQPFQQFHPHPGHPVAQRLQTGGQHGAGARLIQQLAQAAAVEGVEVPRQRLDLMQRHGHHAGVAIAGGDAVDHAFLVQQAVEKARALGNLLAEGGVALQLRAGAALGQGDHLLDGQRHFAEGHGVRLMGGHARSRTGRS